MLLLIIQASLLGLRELTAYLRVSKGVLNSFLLSVSSTLSFFTEFKLTTSPLTLTFLLIPFCYSFSVLQPYGFYPILGSSVDCFSMPTPASFFVGEEIDFVVVAVPLGIRLDQIEGESERESLLPLSVNDLLSEGACAFFAPFLTFGLVLSASQSVSQYVLMGF